MTRNILEAVSKARAFFEIENYPGDFFSRLEKVNYIDKYGILLFKEDIDKLSGFIGYGANDIAVICVNYKRFYGHQNFTLAHEFGHWFLHKGISISDDDSVLGYLSNKIEQEANEFAGELLYPEELLVKDHFFAIQQDLFFEKNRKKLGEYVDQLCHKYCLSYEMVLRRLLYKNRQGKQYRAIRKEIEMAIGGKVSEIFEKNFYAVNEKLPQYQKLLKPYLELDNKVDQLVAARKISVATGDAIKLRTGDEIFTVANLCKESEQEITITETILNELEPGYYLEIEDENAKNAYNAVHNLTLGTMGIKIIRLVKLEEIPGAKEELKKIRQRFYGWMKDGNYLRYLISQGKISESDIKKKSFRNKDMGECELIAIAKVSDNEHQIVTNDKGRVFLHPEQNLFDEYASEIGLTVLNSDEWLRKIGHIK